jgi:RHS repeat-associated protein
MIAIDEIILDRKARVAGRGARGMDRGAPRSMNQNHPRSAPYRSNFYRLNPSFSWHYARDRNYDPTLGRWINQDPAGYINGANTYQFVMSNPVNAVDPSGEKAGDQWYGYNDPTFRDWVHRQGKEKGQPDFTKDQAKDLYDVWKNRKTRR